MPHQSTALRRSIISCIALCTCALVWIPQVQAAVHDSELTLTPGDTMQEPLGNDVAGIGLTLSQPGTLSLQIKDNGTWGDWSDVTIDPDALPFSYSTPLVFTDNATAVRLRSDREMDVTLHSITVSTEPIRTQVAGARMLGADVVIPRWKWADDSFRVAHGAPRSVQRAETYDKVGPDRFHYCSVRAQLYPDEFREENRQFYNDEGDPLWWPVGYSDKYMFILHHTATPIGSSNRPGLERMRAIYQYHAVARKWGDIGYNFVIDPEGNIYEGRAGGDKAVGAHAYCNNVGTIGVSLMGNFQIEEPTRAQMQALRYLLASKSREHNIDPTGRVLHHGKLTPTIIAHSDVGQTACAGQHLNETLPQLRQAVKSQDYVRPIFTTNAKPSTNPEAALVGYPDRIALSAGESKTYTVKFMNMGVEDWTRDTWLMGEADDMFFTQYLPYSFVAGFLQEELVRPGEVGSFEVTVQAGVDTEGGNRSMRLTPVINNERRLVRKVANLNASIHPAKASFTHVTSYFPPLHISGEDLTGVVKIFNGGSVPWKKDTITGIHFVVDGAPGEVSVLQHPQQIDPGKQGSFKIRLLNVHEEGKYERKILPKMIGGNDIEGSAILVASRAEPLPEVTFTSTGETEVLAQSRRAFERGRATVYDGVSLETTIGTNLTLSPKEQVEIPVRIRAGKKGVVKNQILADVEVSSNTIVLRDENNRRVRKVLRSPLALLRNQSELMHLTLRAPQGAGSYSFSIGTITFDIVVRNLPRKEVTKKKNSLSSLILSRTAARDAARARRIVRMSTRKAREQANAPSTPVESDDVSIRIRLHYNKDTASIKANSSLHIQGQGGIITTSGIVHINKDREFCSVVTANGRLTERVIRFWPGSADGLIQIPSMNKSANTYRGVIECRVIDDQLTLINELPIEQYLAGMIEEPDTEPWEKQRAFAIAARTYALYYTLGDQTKFPGKPYHGSDSPREFQAYGGAYFEQRNPQWVKAVQDTRGKVLTYLSKIIKPPYFSSDDGRTRSAFEVWGWTHTPYLISVPDPGCVGFPNNGHLVGMSGCGSEAKANAGETAEQILDYYYPDTRILPYNSDRIQGLHTK
jgi:hypothetical protein